MQIIPSSAFADTKPHYELLDGLRGVAALLVVWNHIFEGYSFSSGAPYIRYLNHGYLAVDFFFILSGFVISYAYDGRWVKPTFTMKGFFRRRLIRLHPMVVMAALIGFITYLLQGGVTWGGEHVATSMVMLALLCSMFFIPAWPGAGFEVRGNNEMFPLNGPSWSLFFEYIGNILYALFVHRFSNKQLTILVVILGVTELYFTIGNVVGLGSFDVGWTLGGYHFIAGMVRMTFPLTMGMLVQRCIKLKRIRGAFWACSLALFIMFCVPYIEPIGTFCLNGAYESFCIICVFPVLVWLGASGVTTDRFSRGVCKFFGDISYPVYIVHYPLMYLFYAWLIDSKLYTFHQTWAMTLTVVIGSIVLAYACLKLYDEPVRRWLTKKTQTLPK